MILVRRGSLGGRMPRGGIRRLLRLLGKLLCRMREIALGIEMKMKSVRR